MKAVLATISGRVQGVGYRDWCVDVARRLGVRGWVRNRREGQVEALFAGDIAAVDAMLLEAHKGPTMARVDAVHTTATALPADAKIFERRPTA